jgi:hypothetical protein
MALPKSGTQEKITLDDLVLKLVPDPKAPPELALLSGFLGASAEEGFTRLYSDAVLSRYVDVPNEAIVLTRPQENASLGGSLVWVNRSAHLKPGPTADPAHSTQAQNQFLEGQLTGENTVNQAAIPSIPLTSCIPTFSCFPTLSCITQIHPVCAAQGTAGGAQSAHAGFFPTIPVTSCIPTFSCPTVQCIPTLAGCITHINPVCAAQGTAGGAQSAQAGFFPTIPVTSCIPTFSCPTVQCIPTLAGCVTHIPPFC